MDEMAAAFWGLAFIVVLGGLVIGIGAGAIVRHILGKNYTGNVHILNLKSAVATGALFSAFLLLPIGFGFEDANDLVTIVFFSLAVGFAPVPALLFIFEVFALAHWITQKITKKNRALVLIGSGCKS